MRYLRLLLLAGNGLTLTLTGTCIGFCPLTTNGESPTMPQTAVTTNVHQTLNVETHLGPESTFHGVFVVENRKGKNLKRKM